MIVSHALKKIIGNHNLATRRRNWKRSRDIGPKELLIEHILMNEVMVGRDEWHCTFI